MFASVAGLFITAFLAATILPMQSEALLATLLLKTDVAPWVLVAAGAFGNTLGACVNWFLGRYIETFKTRKWFPVSAKALETAQRHYMKYGRWSLLLSWVPLIGDPITVMAGVLKEKLYVFVMIVGVAKTARYIALAYAILAYQQV